VGVGEDGAKWVISLFGLEVLVAASVLYRLLIDTWWSACLGKLVVIALAVCTGLDQMTGVAIGVTVDLELCVFLCSVSAKINGLGT